jgi:RNA polymerase sigma factor (sigma-70 family)
VARTTSLAELFEADRPHLRRVALRMLGSVEDADDAVQEAWLRLSTSGDEIQNLTGWLTTVVSRICLTMLRDRQRHGSEPFDEAAGAEHRTSRVPATPEDQAVLADAVGQALLLVLDALTPDERIAFVLHDTFSISFGEIAGILGKSPEACRQLASRARRRIRSGGEPATVHPERQREMVGAFLAAARTGELSALLALLSPDVELVADDAAVSMGAARCLAGPSDVAARFSGARGARAAILDGLAGLAWVQGGTTKVAFEFSLVGDYVQRIEMIGDPDVLAAMEIELLGAKALP